MDKSLAAALVWFRRDLRASDHAALYHALRAARRVWCVFVFDRDILDDLLAQGSKADRRVEFIHDSVRALDADLRTLAASCGAEGGGLIVRDGPAVDEIAGIAQSLQVQAVYANHDDDPAALARDARARGALADLGIALHTAKDHVVFERDELLTGSGTPYNVFTPYKKAWLAKADAFYLGAYPVEKHAAALAAPPTHTQRQEPPPSLESLGFEATNLHALGLDGGSDHGEALLADFLGRIDHYDTARDFPAKRGPSYLSVHLRFGTLSVRALARETWLRMHAGSRGASVWLSELIWRDFYHQILHHHPHVVDSAFRPALRRAALGTWQGGRRALRRLGRRAHRLPAGGRGDVADRAERLHAQPAAHGRGQLPREGPRHRLAARRGLLRAPSQRLRPRVEQRRLAVGGLHRLRRAALVSHLQPGDAEPQVRPRRALHPALSAAVRGLARRRDPCAVAGAAGDLAAAGVELGVTYPRPIVDHAEARKRTLAALCGGARRQAASRSPARKGPASASDDRALPGVASTALVV